MHCPTLYYLVDSDAFDALSTHHFARHPSYSRSVDCLCFHLLSSNSTHSSTFSSVSALNGDDGDCDLGARADELPFSTWQRKSLSFQRPVFCQRVQSGRTFALQIVDGSDGDGYVRKKCSQGILWLHADSLWLNCPCCQQFSK